MQEVVDFAQVMSRAKGVLRKDFFENPGGCLALTMQALRWEMDPFAVAAKAYIVDGGVAYEAQLVHAVVNTRAPIEGPLQTEYAGEGDMRTIVVRGTLRGGEVKEYLSPPLRQIKGKSPLWTKDPDQQLHYYGTRSWARRWCPEVLLGIYTPDELAAGMGPAAARDVTPGRASERFAATLAAPKETVIDAPEPSEPVEREHAAFGQSPGEVEGDEAHAGVAEPPSAADAFPDDRPDGIDWDAALERLADDLAALATKALRAARWKQWEKTLAKAPEHIRMQAINVRDNAER